MFVAIIVQFGRFVGFLFQPMGLKLRNAWFFGVFFTFGFLVYSSQDEHLKVKSVILQPGAIPTLGPPLLSTPCILWGFGKCDSGKIKHSEPIKTFHTTFGFT